MSSILVLLYLLIKDQVSPHSTLTPRFRLSYNFNNSRAGQNTCKKGKTKSDKALNGAFFKDMILLGGPDHEKVLGKEHGYGLCKMAMLLQLLLFLRSGMRKICMIFLFVIFLQAVSGWQCLGSNVGSLSFNGSFPSSGPDFMRLSVPKGLQRQAHLRSTCARDSSYGTIVQESKGCQRGKGSWT